MGDVRRTLHAWRSNSTPLNLHILYCDYMMHASVMEAQTVAASAGGYNLPEAAQRGSATTPTMSEQ